MHVMGAWPLTAHSTRVGREWGVGCWVYPIGHKVDRYRYPLLLPARYHLSCSLDQTLHRNPSLSTTTKAVPLNIHYTHSFIKMPHAYYQSESVPVVDQSDQCCYPGT